MDVIGFGDDHVDDIYTDISRDPSTEFSSVMPYTGSHGNSMIELSFRVQCAGGHGGRNCDQICSVCLTSPCVRGICTCTVRKKFYACLSWSLHISTIFSHFTVMEVVSLSLIHI